MPRAGPRKVQRYSLEFKLKAVRLSRLKGVEVQAVMILGTAAYMSPEQAKGRSSVQSGPTPMALSPGTRLGPYEITAQIGVGGMGKAGIESGCLPPT